MRAARRGAGLCLVASLAWATPLLTKRPDMLPAGAGDTVQFRICWSNYSAVSSFTFVVTEQVPVGMTFVPESTTASFDCGNSRGRFPVIAYSQSTAPVPPAAWTTGNPINTPAVTRWLRWTFASVDTATTGCLCYRASMDNATQDGIFYGRGASATLTEGGIGTSVTYSATARIIVANPQVNIWKASSPSYLSTTGGLVTFSICFSNAGSNTAFGVTVFDRLPNNTFWNPVGYSGWWGQLSGAGSSFTANGATQAWSTALPSWSPLVIPSSPAAGTNTGSPPTYLQWVVPALGIGRSGCIAYVVSVG